MRLLSPAVCALAAAVLAAQGAQAGECKRVNTTIVTTYFMAGCRSPVGLCTEGVVPSGPLKGTTRFSALSVKEGASPDLMVYTGELVITTKKGKVTIHDAGILDTATGAFYELQEIVGGTEDLRHATGLLTSRGMATGTGFTGSLKGLLCTPHKRDHRKDKDHRGDSSDDDDSDFVDPEDSGA